MPMMGTHSSTAPSLAKRADVLDRLFAASTDQRAHNVRYRQRQLHFFHGLLQQNATTICDIMTKDLQYRSNDSILEYSAAMILLGEIYDQVDFSRSLEEEYAVSHNQSNLSARTPHGTVFIRHGTRNVFYGIVSAVAAALAAGNCVLLEVSLLNIQ